MKLTLHPLYVFQKIAKLNRVTKAAQALQLNESLANPVTEVLNKKIYLTSAGKVLLDANYKIQNIINEALSQINYE